MGVAARHVDEDKADAQLKVFDHRQHPRVTSTPSMTFVPGPSRQVLSVLTHCWLSPLLAARLTSSGELIPSGGSGEVRASNAPQPLAHDSLATAKSVGFCMAKVRIVDDSPGTVSN